MVFRRCRRLLKDEQAAKDATQETFARLVRYDEQLDEAAPCSLLYRMATNVSLNRLRTRRRRPEDADDELVDAIVYSTAYESAGVARQFLQKLFGDEAASTQTIAVLYYLDGMTYEEVAAEVGLSVSGVRKRLRGLKIRAEALKETSHG
jgi:RNA polymerase sigma-70 factor (ECF subfamily)